MEDNLFWSFVRPLWQRQFSKCSLLINKFPVKHEPGNITPTGWIRKKYHRPLKNHSQKSGCMVKIYMYGSKVYYVFGVLWKNEIVWKSHFQDMSDYTIIRNHNTSGFFVMIFQRSVVLLSDSPCRHDKPIKYNICIIFIT